jgi:hypothetical protein
VLTKQQLRKTRERVDEQIASQRKRVTGRVRTLGRALKGAGDMLEEDELVSSALHFASDNVETVAGYVEELSPEQVAEDLRDVARNRPAWFFGGAFVLGLALGRFARSSAGNLSASQGAAKPSARRAAASAQRRIVASSPRTSSTQASAPGRRHD